MFVRKRLGVLAVVGLLLAGSAARAQDAEAVNDTRCLLVGILLAAKDDPTVSSAGLMASFYYLGRLDGHAPNADLAKSVLDQIAKLKPEDYDALAKSCGAILKERGQAMTAAGKQIKDQAEDAAKPRI
jgi:hypothetical protein